MIVNVQIYQLVGYISAVEGYFIIAFHFWLLPNAGGFCGTVDNGDYSYKVETIGDNVVFQFHPLAPIAGCAYALIYVRKGLTGGYPGYAMQAIGADFIFTKPIASGTPISIYFTYSVPSGGERNSSATPHSYTVGTICDGILPVNLLSFTAALQTDGNVAVNWSTATEQNNDYFLIEKSKDGRSYTTLAKIAASKNTVNKTDYKVHDNHAVNGTNYYRLTQVDKDARSIVSGVRTVNVIKKNAGITVYPNPLKGTLINVLLTQPSVNKLNVQLLNMAGKVIYSSSVTAQGNTLQLKLSAKPAAGVYLLKVEGNNPVKIVVD